MAAFCRKIFFITLLCFACAHVHAQSIPNLDIIKLDHAPDFKAAEPFALQTSIYLLTTPFDKENKDRVKGLQFLIRWMSGTPDHSFIIDNVESKVAKGDDDILSLYLAALTRYTLENKDAAKDNKTLTLHAVILLLDYCENKANNIKMPKQLKKLSEARTRGELEKALQ